MVVHVIDMNDNPPQFLETSYSVTVPEDIVAGTPILTVRATDRDGSQPNNDIIYRSFIYIYSEKVNERVKDSKFIEKLNS